MKREAPSESEAPAPPSRLREDAEAFAPPRLQVDLPFLAEHFALPHGRAPAPIRNYHHERPIPDAVRRDATPAAVLIPIVERDEGLGLLLTRRHHAISYPGQVCYPGGRSDPEDPSPEATALREAREEIDLDPESVRILGRLGLYHTQSGYRITPIVGVVRPPLALHPAPDEVSEILEVPLARITDPGSYRIWRTDTRRGEAFYAFEHAGVRINGPTVCMTMGFFEALARTHAARADRGVRR